MGYFLALIYNLQSLVGNMNNGQGKFPNIGENTQNKIDEEITGMTFEKKIIFQKRG